MLATSCCEIRAGFQKLLVSDSRAERLVRRSGCSGHSVALLPPKLYVSPPKNVRIAAQKKGRCAAVSAFMRKIQHESVRIAAEICGPLRAAGWAAKRGSNATRWPCDQGGGGAVRTGRSGCWCQMSGLAARLGAMSAPLMLRMCAGRVLQRCHNGLRPVFCVPRESRYGAVMGL